MRRSSTSQDRPHRFERSRSLYRGHAETFRIPSLHTDVHIIIISSTSLRIDVTHHAVWPRRTCTHSKNDAIIQHTQTTTRRTLPRQQHIHSSNTCEYQQHTWHEGILSRIIHVTHHVTNLPSYYSTFHYTPTLGPGSINPYCSHNSVVTRQPCTTSTQPPSWQYTHYKLR